MLRRLLVVLVPLWAALFVALGVPLAVNIAERETQVVYLDRLADAARFAALADDSLRRNNVAALTAEIKRYDEVYGVAVALFAIDGRLLMTSRESFDADTPEVRAGLTAAFAGYRNERITAGSPWRHDPIVIVEPVGRDTGVVAAVVTVSPTGHLASTILQRWDELAGVGGVLFGLAVVASLLLARWVLRPVRDLDRATVAIAAGRIDARAVTVSGPLELRRLVGSFNTMIETVARTLGRQRTFVADASHQLRNPLASLHLAVDNLSEHLRPSGRELHEIAQTEVAEMGHVVDHLLALTLIEGAALATAPQPVTGMFESRGTRWQRVAEAAGMKLVVDIPDRPPDGLATYAPADALGNLLDELIGNACRLSGATTVRVTAVRSGTEVTVSVSDDGMGLADDELVMASERFWRGRAHADVPGTGLGLAICRELVAAWGGRLTLCPAHPTGLEARICLPAADVVSVDQGFAERK